MPGWHLSSALFDCCRMDMHFQVRIWNAGTGLCLLNHQGYLPGPCGLADHHIRGESIFGEYVQQGKLPVCPFYLFYCPWMCTSFLLPSPHFFSPRSLRKSKQARVNHLSVFTNDCWWYSTTLSCQVANIFDWRKLGNVISNVIHVLDSRNTELLKELVQQCHCRPIIDLPQKEC